MKYKKIYTMLIVCAIINVTFFNIGLAKDKVINGTPVPKGGAPYYVGLVRNGKKVDCGGTLIASKYVLTAAHCVATTVDRLNGPTSYDAYIGLTEFNKDESDIKKVYSDKSAIEGYFMLPEYTKDSEEHVGGLHGDIAVIVLKTPVTEDLSKKVALVSTETPNLNEILKSEGFGYTKLHDGMSSPNYLMSTEMKVIDNSLCKISGVDRGYKICLGSVHSGSEFSSVYFSDSGGPLIKKIGDITIVSGIVEQGYFSTPAENIPYNTLFENVSAYSTWINSRLFSKQSLIIHNVDCKSYGANKDNRMDGNFDQHSVAITVEPEGGDKYGYVVAVYDVPVNTFKTIPWDLGKKYSIQGVTNRHTYTLPKLGLIEIVKTRDDPDRGTICKVNVY